MTNLELHFLKKKMKISTRITEFFSREISWNENKFRTFLKRTLSLNYNLRNEITKLRLSLKFDKYFRRLYFVISHSGVAQAFHLFPHFLF